MIFNFGSLFFGKERGTIFNLESLIIEKEEKSKSGGVLIFEENETIFGEKEHFNVKI